MALRGEFDLDIAKFRGKLAEASREVNRSAGQMKRESAGIGQSMVKGFDGLGRVLGSVGLGLGLSEMAQGIKSALQYGDDLADLSEALNENAESLQRVDFAAKQTASVGVDQMSKALLKLEKNLGDVENRDAAEILERYGISAGKLMAMPLEQKILALSGAFQKARTDGTGVADLMDLMGRSGTELIPMLTQSRDALEGLFNRAPIVSDSDIRRMAEVNDQLDAMMDKAKIFAVEFVGNMTTGWQAFSDFFEGKNPVDEMMKREREMNLKRAALASQREAGAASLQAAQDAVGQAAQEKASKDLTDKATKAQAALEAARLAALPEAQRIPALEGQLQGIFARMLTGTGLEGQGKAGLQRMIEGLNTDYGRERQIPFIEALTEAEKVEREITKLKEHQAELAKKEAESKLAVIRTTALEADLVSGRRGATGAVQATIDAIFGRTSDPVLRENQSQTGLLRSIDRRLSGMQLAGAGAGGVDEFRNFP